MNPLASSPGTRLRILTYNVHSCIGSDRQLSPHRIAEVIAACEPDVVALQELDVGRVRTGGVDQALEIATTLEMEMHFHPALQVMEEAYGDAILTALPSHLVKAGALPGLPRRPGLEPRGALWASIQVGDHSLQIVNTHLGLWAPEQLAQVEALLGPEWLAHPDCRGPAMLIGDLNALPGSRPYRRLAAQLHDAQRAAGPKRARATFPSRFPLMRIDHMFFRGAIAVNAAEVVRSRLARIASDHLPLVVDLTIGAGRPG